MQPSLRHIQNLHCLRVFIQKTLANLHDNVSLPKSKLIRKIWNRYWGKASYSNRVSPRELDFHTRRRKAYLMRLFRIASDEIHTNQISSADAAMLRERLSLHRRRMHPSICCVALAIDAALAQMWLRERPDVQKMKLAICYSAFGDINRVAKIYGRETQHFFTGIFAELHLFATSGMITSSTNITEQDSVKIHFNKTTFSQLVAFPGIKAPGLVGACADAIQNKMDIIITIDGDARLPLFLILPALATLFASETTDAVLGSRRVAGAFVAKPGFRHLTSMLNASYVETVMAPVLGHIRDPQAIFKVFRKTRLRCALERLGYGNGSLTLNDLQDGSLACELFFLSNLTDNGCLPHLIEVPVIETMAYPRNPGRMPIMTSENINAMIAAANRPRLNLREKPLLGEGTESLVISQSDGGALKYPRRPERLSERKGLPTSRVTDNRILDIVLSFSGVLKTIVCTHASRLHPDRGFGINPVILDLIKDKRPEVQACIPDNMHLRFLKEDIRLPFPTALVLKVSWQVDRMLLNFGMILERIGMQPTIVIRLVSAVVRLFRFFSKWLRLIFRFPKRVARRLFSWFLRVWDKLHSLVYIITRWILTQLESFGIFRIFALIDRLDQRNRFFHGCIRGIIRIWIEIRWLLESFNVSVNFGRPVLCLVQPQTIRPFWSVLKNLPRSMTGEIETLLNKALDLYNTLGKCGYVDGELSLDNIGFQINGSNTRFVLMDYGSVVNIHKTLPDILQTWLQIVKTDYKNSYQVYKLRNLARNHNELVVVVETYINKSLELIDRWKQQILTEAQSQPMKCY